MYVSQKLTEGCKRFMLSVFALVLISGTIVAQNIRVTGKVTDKAGQPAIGVSVLIEGTRTGVATDLDGTFTLDAPANAFLLFSSIGMENQRVPVDNRKVINVTMAESTVYLEETVVTALGIKKEKRALGYAVQDLKSEELLKNKTANPINSLAGKIAGVSVTQSSGAAGSGAQIILRGGTSLERDNQPVFVVDGVIYDNSTSVVGNSAFDGMTSTATTFSNRVMDINPEDIENISILKGPAAAALYGSRAANGVIIITTKKGAPEGTISVEVSSKFASFWANRLPEQQSMYKRGLRGTNGSIYDLSGQMNKTFSSWGEVVANNETIYDNIGSFFQNGKMWDNTVSIAGGHKNGNYYLSASRFDQDGIIPTTGYDKMTFRFNAEQKYGKLTVGAGAAYSQANTQKTLTSSGLWGSGGVGTMNAVYGWSRSDDMKHYLNDDGTKYRFYPDETLGYDMENPYWILYKNKMTDHTDRFTGNINANFKITDWWDISYRFGIDTYTTGNYNLIYPGAAMTKELFQNGMLSENELKHQYLSSNIMTNFHKTYGDFDFGLLLGYIEEENKNETNYRMGYDFAVSDFFSFSTIIDANKKLFQSHSMDRLHGLYGEFRVSYKNYAYLTVTGRNDKSSTLYSPILGDKNASYWYPSVSGSFVFTELLPKSNVLSFGKIRASWANVGKATQPYVTNTELWPFQEFLGGFISTSNSWFRGNPYLKPEMTKSVELGLEMRFFNGRVGFDYTYYTNNSYSQILNPRTSQATGYILNLTNAGDIYNKGMELSITGKPILTKNFTWDATLNFAGNRGTVANLAKGIDILYVTDVQVGNAKAASFNKGNFMGISGSKWKQTTDGKIVLDVYGMPTSDNQTTYEIGNREPKLFGGFNNSLQYKNWNLSFLLDFRIGGDVYNGTEYAMTLYGLSKRTQNRSSLTTKGVINTGTTDNPVYEDASFTFNSDQSYQVGTNTNNTPIMQDGKYIIQQYWRDYYLRESANFMTETNWLRLRNISISYNLSNSILNRTKFIKGCVITVSGNNLFMITNYKGMDPETAASGSGATGSSSVGIEYCNVPATAGMSFGINLKF